MSHEVISADIVYGLSYGDESKGKVSSYLSSKLSRSAKIFNSDDKHYDFVVRWGGGANAGHTVYVGSKKYKTHLIPSGVFHGIKSLIGPGCVLNPASLKEELSYLNQNGFDTSLVRISPNAQIVTEEHIQIDKDNLAKKLGTTSKGIAPAYAAKYARTGVQFKDLASQDPFWKSFLFDGRLYGHILCEGAQGFYLDINWGNYPYVTSSETLPYAACSVGFSPKKIKDIYAVAKIYETRSGEDPIFPESLFDNPELARIGEVGQEYGVTTGRRRKVNYLNLDRLIFALNTAGGNHLIISKCDILEETDIFKLFYRNDLISFDSLDLMKNFVTTRLSVECPELEKIYYSSSTEIVEGLNL
jgi:adenylosuccinate synthase